MGALKGCGCRYRLFSMSASLLGEASWSLFGGSIGFSFFFFAFNYRYGLLDEIMAWDR
jgi:hypothetical protein